MFTRTEGGVRRIEMELFAFGLVVKSLNREATRSIMEIIRPILDVVDVCAYGSVCDLGPIGSGRMRNSRLTDDV